MFQTKFCASADHAVITQMAVERMTFCNNERRISKNLSV